MDDPHLYPHLIPIDPRDGDGQPQVPLPPPVLPPVPLPQVPLPPLSPPPVPLPPVPLPPVPLPLPPEPQSPWASSAVPQATGTRVAGRARALLGALALLLVITVVGTCVLVLRDLHIQVTGPSPVTRATATATATVPPGTPTPVLPRDPKDNGWTEVGRGVFGDAKFAPSSVQRGYLCGQDGTKARRFGVTTDGGQTWQFGASPAGYDTCWLQISPTNPLDVVLNSAVGNCAGGSCPGLDAHYSTDGGRTWKMAPIPQGTEGPGGAVWVGPYLYLWVDAYPPTGQQGFLQVSANGGAFRPLDRNALVPGGHDVHISSAIAEGTKLYLSFDYNGCSLSECFAIVTSGDGGKTWTQASNTFAVQLLFVVGGTMYGQVRNPLDGSTQIVTKPSVLSAAWIPVTLPPLPDGQTLMLDVQRSWLPAPDGTIFAADPTSQSVASLRAGAWTVLPFSSQGSDEFLAAVSLGTDGRRQRVWMCGVLTGSNPHVGLYWHALP